MSELVPKVSVVVSTRNRHERIRSLVTSLAEQDLDLSDFEVVLVDDGSDFEVSKTFAFHPPPEKLRLIIARRPESGGAAAGRNVGWRIARAPLVAFTDDDCRPHPGWLLELVSVADGDPEAVVQGRTVPDPNDGPAGPFDHTMRVDGPNQLFETCNIAYPRTLLERCGGFDESFRGACGEDVDLGWRAKEAGARLTYAKQALVYHAVIATPLRGQLRRTFQWIVAVRIMKEYPELRVMLDHGVFWKRSHPPLIGLFAGVLLAARARALPVAIIAAIPYLVQARDQHGDGRGAWIAAARSLPRHILIDSCEVITMFAGSVRYRTLIL